MTSLADLHYEAAHPEPEQEAKPLSKAEMLARLSLELRGIPDVEPSNKTTVFEAPHSIDWLRPMELTATFMGKTITVEFEYDAAAPWCRIQEVVAIVHGDMPEYYRDELERWFEDWYDRQAESR